MSSASAAASGADPLAAMAAYARFAHDVISLPAAEAAAAQKNKQKNQRNLQFTDGRWTQMASMCGAVGELLRMFVPVVLVGMLILARDVLEISFSFQKQISKRQ